MVEAASVGWWDSKLVRWFNLGIACAAGVLLCSLALREEIDWLGWFLLGTTVVFLIMLRWPYGALFVLIGLSAMPAFFVEIFGWKGRPEHFAAVATFVAVCFWLRVRKRAVGLDRLDWWVFAYVAINYASSALGSSAPSSTLRWALQNNLAVLPYFLIRVLVKDLQTFRKGFLILLTVGAAECIYGLLCYFSHQAFDTTTGVSVGQYLVDVSAPYGSMYEPNLFGAYAACCAVLFLALYFDQVKHRVSYLVFFLIASVATVLSFSRAALLALVIAVSWVVWRGRRRRQGPGHGLAIAGLILTLALVIGITPIGDVVVERLTNVYYEGLTEESAITRFVVLADAMGEIPQHPFLGSGTASFQLSFDWAKYVPAWADVPVWIGNSLLRILHDTGLIGLAAFIGFVISLWARLRKSSHASNRQLSKLLGLSAGALVYSISFQFTDGTTLAFFWVHMGFLASAAILMTAPNHEVPGAERITSRGLLSDL